MSDPDVLVSFASGHDKPAGFSYCPRTIPERIAARPGVVLTSSLAQNALDDTPLTRHRRGLHRQTAQSFRLEKLQPPIPARIFDHAQRPTRMLRNAPHPTMTAGSPSGVDRPFNRPGCPVPPQTSFRYVCTPRSASGGTAVAPWLVGGPIARIRIADESMGHTVTSSTHCPYCALQCGMHLTGTADSVQVAGNARFPVNKGGLCVKGWHAAGTLGHPDRLTTPLVRDAGGTLRPATWDRALDLIARRVGAVQAAHGRDAVGVFGSGALTNEKAYLLGKFARAALQTSNIDYNGRFCMSSGAAASVRAFGLDRGLPFPLEDIPRAGAVLLAGSNPGETMPPLMQYFASQRANGGKLVVADPRPSTTAEWATIHLQAAPRLRRRARQRPPARLHPRRPDRRALHRGTHRRIRRRPCVDAGLRSGTRRAGDGSGRGRSGRRRAHPRRGAVDDDPHRPGAGTAVARRRQRPRLHQSRAGAGAGRPRRRWLRLHHRARQRAGRS